MGQHQHELRRAAARAFAESLDQLQETLQSANSQPEQGSVKPNNTDVKPNNTAPAQSDSDSTAQFDLDSFEQAVADIEQFMTQKEEEKP